MHFVLELTFTDIHHAWVVNSPNNAGLLKEIAVFTPALFAQPDVLALYNATTQAYESTGGALVGVGTVLYKSAESALSNADLDDAVRLQLWANVIGHKGQNRLVFH